MNEKNDLVWDLLLKITQQANELNSDRVIAGKELIRVSDEYYNRKRQLTVNDNIANLRSSDLRDAEVGLILEQEGLVRKYGEARLKSQKAEKKWECLDIMSANCRALLYGEKPTSKVTVEEASDGLADDR